MIIDFQQGIITYPASGTIQQFLGYSGGYVTLRTSGGRTDVSFAHGSENYLHTESTDVPQAWGPIEPTTDAWLYFDLDSLTAARTFGITYVQPTYGEDTPSAPLADQHWFDTTSRKMMVYRGGKWINKIRVFACKINNGVFSPMGSNAGLPYAGTQVGIISTGITTGRIVVDDTGAPIRRQNGLLFTTEDEFFVNGSPVNTVRLESNVLNGTAKESIARYQVVKFTEFGRVNLATYDDEQTTAIAMAMEDMNQGQTGTLCMQGVITNPQWSWDTVGAALWVHGSIPGVLVEYDPHVADAAMYPVGKPPVARVLTPTSIFFDQGLGGKGDKGDQSSALVPLATTTVFGVAKLSVPAANTSNPIVVGDNDPRNANDRNPLPHNQSATTITTTPVGILTGSNVQEDLQIINDSFVKKAGDTMTGPLTLSGAPTNNLHATTKQYVDARTLNDLADVVVTSPVVEDVLKYDGTGWINGPGQSAQLWTSSSRNTQTDYIPATCTVSFTICLSYGMPYATVDALLNSYVSIPLDIVESGRTFTVSIDGTSHSYIATPDDIILFNASNKLSTVLSAMSTYLNPLGVTITPYVTGTTSGIILTSTNTNVSELLVSNTNLLIATGSACTIITSHVIGVPSVHATKNPILTPSPHTPAFVETYIPMHTVIDSDPPVSHATFWLDALADQSSLTSSLQTTCGPIAVSQSSPALYDVVYVVGSYDGTTKGITIEAHDIAGSAGQAGRLLGLDDEFAGRVVIPVVPSGFTPSSITPAGIVVNKDSGDVYTLTGMSGSMAGSNLSIAVLSCISADLSVVKWQRTIQMGNTNTTGGTWITEARSGLAIDTTTNTLYVAVPVVRDWLQGELAIDPPVSYQCGVLLLSVNSANGSINWSIQEVDRGSEYGFLPTASPASVAVYSKVGDVRVLVAFNTIVMCVWNDGAISWKRDIQQADNVNTYATSGITINQTTGEVYVAAIQSPYQPPPEA